MRIKSSYRGETRLLVLDTQSFPSYTDLYHQLYRVFPISNSFYLSRLLFSADSSDSRILIAREVRNEEEYNKAVAQFAGRIFPNAMLRFSVFDETPHKTPSSLALQRANPAFTSIPQLPPTPSVSTGSPIHLAHIPPPPIIYSSVPKSLPMEVASSSTPIAFTSKSIPQPIVPQHHDQSARTDTAAAVQSLITQFKDDLGDILKQIHPASPKTPQPSPLPLNGMCLYKYCAPCGKIFQGPWYACEKCNEVMCVSCHDGGKGTSFCQTLFGQHSLKKETCAACPKPVAITPAPSLSPISTISWAYPPSAPPINPTPSVSFVPTPPTDLPLPSTVVVPEPSIHRGVTCDVCQTHPIQGTRHKCLDCPDYDLCTPCIASGFAERHNPFHEFFEITEPGRVVVHNIDSRVPVDIPAQAEEAVPVVHNATCDLCDSRINGNRYKCCHCPDFDTCEPCYGIVKEQHPGHSFVRLKEAKDYLAGESAERVRHYASCNACTKGINGVRYKCMHPMCPDYDLCEECEAHPIALHPRNHPMLKVKSADTVIPSVQRTSSIPTGIMTGLGITSAQPVSVPQSFEPIAPAPAASPIVATPAPFIYPVSSAHSPIRAPSPPLLIPGAMPVVNEPTETPVVLDPVSSLSSSLDSTPSLASSQLQLPPLSLQSSPWPGSSALLDLLSNHNDRVATTPLVPEPFPENTPVAPISVDSPLTGQEILLSRPISSSDMQEMPEKQGSRSLEELLGNYQSPPESLASSLEVLPVEQDKSMKEEQSVLSAEFISDVTVPDGQVFPPGAEFVKCWKMKNSGNQDWPENTELIFVAGETLSRDGAMSVVKVGSIKAGEEVELSTDDLKAPEAPGRYVSYWRLRNDKTLFGDNIWLDVVVGETGDRLSESSESSMSSSSVIIMPQLAAEQRSVATTASTVDDETASVSDGSSISLVSMPSSEDEVDDAMWQDSRSSVRGNAEEYVVLFDDRDSSEEE